jgi:hypothetical protein
VSGGLPIVFLVGGRAGRDIGDARSLIGEGTAWWSGMTADLLALYLVLAAPSELLRQLR